MVHKRQLGDSSGEGSEFPNKHFLSTLEHEFRKWVREEVDISLEKYHRCHQNLLEGSGSRILYLQFESNLPDTLFTCSNVVSSDKNPVKIVLYDSNSRKIITSGPLSSIKVIVTVLDADFGPDDREGWTKNEFDRKIVQNREGKRPLVTGDLAVTLKDGVGYVGEFYFTDNSSWIRSGKFRLGAKAHSSEYGRSIREGVSNAFKVKDHRGESYQKHYPPSLDDEVWRLEKIAKDGASHKKLTKHGVTSVRDFLFLNMANHKSLRSMLRSTSTKAWEKIIGHAETCAIDDTKYMYRTAQGHSLFFNLIYKVLGVSFDGQNCLHVDNLNAYQKIRVDDLKQHAYKNLKDWVLISAPSILSYPMVLPGPTTENFNNLKLEQDQLEMQANTDRPSISPPYNHEIGHDNGSFEIGESSHQMQQFNPTFSDSFKMMFNSPYIGEHTWAPGSNYMGSQLSNDDINPVDDNFQVEPSLWQGNGSNICETGNAGKH